MAYDPKVIKRSADEVAKALRDVGHWQEFFELRMAVGPTCRIENLTDGDFAVHVVWDSLASDVRTTTLTAAMESADRLAYSFYEIRLSLGRTIL